MRYADLERGRTFRQRLRDSHPLNLKTSPRGLHCLRPSINDITSEAGDNPTVLLIYTVTVSSRRRRVLSRLSFLAMMPPMKAAMVIH